MRMCPDCEHRPSRDQRAWKADGRCVPCHEHAASRPDAVPRKKAKAEGETLVWAYA